MIVPFLLRKPSDATQRQFVAEQADLGFTYTDVGGTQREAHPPGFHFDTWHVDLGHGQAAFQRARAGLQQWAAHRGAGVEVTPADADLVVGQTVGLVVRIGGLYMRAACRIVSTTNEERRFGFAYGTLPGHPECGEEAFVVHWNDDDRITFDICASSKPRHPLVRLGAPVARVMQKRATRNYLSALQQWVAR